MKRLLVTLSSSSGVLKADSGSVMHGILMGLLPDPWPTSLHQNGPINLSQWLEPQGGGKTLWRIGTLSDELGEVIEQKLRENKELFSTHHQIRIAVDHISTVQRSLSDYLTDRMMSESVPTHVRLYFMTATTHKSQKEYVLFPTVSLIAESIRKKIARYDAECILGDEELSYRIQEQCKIVRYQLETQYFGLEGVRIPGYTGYVEIAMGGESALRSLAAALFALSEYTGIGIKNALGMGGCKVNQMQKGERKLGTTEEG